MAESIWNNNYLLSNLDAQKLYAQSPLTTGVSGTSAYIGLEPSARYNETVLWSGTPTSAITASESFTNFERVDLYIAHSVYGPGQIINLDFNNMGNTGYFAICRPRGTNALNIACIRFSASNLTNEIHTTNSKCVAFGSWSNTTATGAAIVNEAEDLNSIYKVIGINRKEV